MAGATRSWRRVAGIGVALGLAGCQPSGSCDQEAAATVPGETLASWSGGSVRRDQLHGELATQMRDMRVRHALEEYELVSRALDAAIEGTLLEEARVAGGYATIDALVQAEVARRLVEPPAAEVDAELQRMEAQLGGVNTGDGATREAMRGSLVRAMMVAQEEEARATYLEDLKAASGLKLYLPYPDIPRVELEVAPHNPTVGPSEAPVTVTQFVDFQCYYCRRAAPIIERLLAARPEVVRVVFKDFPVPGHPAAAEAAVAAHCADQQGRYLQMSATLHRHLDHLEPGALRRYASQVGLDMEAYDDCFAEPLWRDRVAADAREGRAAGVEQTPTFFVNGKMVTGSIPYARLLDLVDQEAERVRVAGQAGR